jgi:hypothetical protein
MPASFLDRGSYLRDLGAMVRDPEVSPLTMLLIWMDVNDDDGEPDPVDEVYNPLEWSPETIMLELEDHFGSDIPDEAVDRLLAANRCTSDRAFTSPHDFREIGNLINCVSVQVIPGSGGAMDYDRLEADEMCWMVWCQLFLRSPDDEDEQGTDPREHYSEQVKAYMGQILVDEGLGGVEPYPLEGLPRVARGKSTADSFDELAPETFALRDEKVAEIQDYVKANISLFKQQVESLPLKRRVAVQQPHRGPT